MPATRIDGSRSSRVYAYATPLIVFALYLAIVSQISDFYLSRLAALLAFWAALGMSWNLIGGYAGQLSLGHAAFVGLGGYVTLVLQQQFGIVPWIGLLASTFASALAALVVGVTLRLSGIYFALATLAYPLILQVLFTYWGYQEALIPARPAQPFLYMQWRDNRWYAVLFAAILVLCWLATVYLERSRWRYFLTAVREDEAAAAAVGINTWLVKLWAFVISGAIAGLLGVVYAQMLFVVTPETLFGIGVSVQAIIVESGRRHRLRCRAAFGHGDHCADLASARRQIRLDLGGFAAGLRACPDCRRPAYSAWPDRSAPAFPAAFIGLARTPADAVRARRSLP